MKNSSKVLLLAPKCSPFIMGPINKLASELNEINILMHHNYLSEIARVPLGGSFSQVRKFTKSDLNCPWKNKPDNVNVYIPSMLYFTRDASNKSLGDNIFRKFKKTIDKNGIEFDLIDAHFIWPCGYVSAMLKEEYGTPLVISARGYDIYNLPFQDNEWKSKIEYALNSADHIITVSMSNLRCIEKLNVSTPVTVRPNGFKDDLFFPMDQLECKKALKLPLDKKIILTVGNLSEVKGHKYLIKAMDKLLKAKNDIICIIIGSGVLEAKLKKLIQSLELEDYILLMGEKHHHEIPLWMNSADIFVLPSLNEGNPNVMFEALATGLPFIGTKVGGIPEIIKSDDYGLLVEPGDYSELADKIMMAFKNNWDKQKIITYAKQFTWDNIAQDILDIFKSVAIHHQGTNNSQLSKKKTPK